MSHSQFIGSHSGDGTASIQVGRYWLEVGATDGTFAEFEPTEEHKNVAELKQAFKRSSGESRQPPAFAAAENLIRDANDDLGKAEHWTSLLTDLVQGRLDPKSVSAEVDAGLDLLGRLDRSGRHDEALRLARDLSAILALLLRWFDLIRSLELAANSAATLGESAAASHAWALHELGSLQLAAGDPRNAAKNLQRARSIKDTLPPGNGRCATRHNLDSAHRDIYATHARYQKLLKLTAAVIFIPLLLTGGVAAAIVIDKTPGPTTTSIAQKPPATSTTSPTGPTGPTTTIHHPQPPPTDTVKPSPTLTEPPNTTLTTATLTFAGATGTATGDQHSVTLFVTHTNGANAIVPRAIPAFGEYTETVPLSDDGYSAYVTQSDDAGNTGTTATTEFTIDTTGPTVSLKCDDPPTCNGTTTDTTDQITVTVVGTSLATGAQPSTPDKFIVSDIADDGTFKFTLRQWVPRTSYDVVASQTDSAGVTGSSKHVNIVNP